MLTVAGIPPPSAFLVGSYKNHPPMASQYLTTKLTTILLGIAGWGFFRVHQTGSMRHSLLESNCFVNDEQRICRFWYIPDREYFSALQAR